MSLNKKWGVLFGAAAVIFLTAACVLFLNLKLYPAYSYHITEIYNTAATAMYDDVTEAEAYPEILYEETVMESSYDGTYAAGAEKEGTEYTEPENLYAEYLKQSLQIVQRLRLLFMITTIFGLAALFLLLIFIRREWCTEGLEVNLALVSGILFCMRTEVRYYSQFSDMYSVDPNGQVSGYGSVGIIDILIVFLFIMFSVWGLFTFVSFCRKKSPVSWSLLYRLTERAALHKNGFSWMILLPALGSFLWLTAAVFSTMIMMIYGIREGQICIGVSLAELVLAMMVLIDRIRAIREKQQAIIEEAKISERMRVDLIANVSHDLRTPLTSIIGYGELLETETLSEDGRRNLNKLNEKSAYLREMVDAVFELAKVSSGVIRCRQDEIDLIRLLEQTIGDYEDALTAGNLEIRRHYEETQVKILSDGIFLHQIFSNLVSNAIKYTMPNTRIHLKLTVDEFHITVRMMNVANYEMKFTETEILERFARGDASRNSEGNGLGLSIAKAYAEALSGSFHVEVDGEQFTAVVKFPEAVRIS